MLAGPRLSMSTRAANKSGLEVDEDGHVAANENAIVNVDGYDVEDAGPRNGEDDRVRDGGLGKIRISRVKS